LTSIVIDKADMRKGCQVFLDTIYQKVKNIPNYNKMYQIALKYYKWLKIPFNIVHSNALQNILKMGFRVSKYTFWHPWCASQPALCLFV
jgi:hypothetical protein